MTKKFVKITKVDPDKRLVEGYASTEALDSQGERVTRAAIEGALADYMRFGNIREMHQPSAVGKTQVAEMDEKGLKISVKVVDDNAWNKVKEGVYNGFSIGGNATVKNGNVIEALDLTEISLVDRPANPEALITLFKAENSTMSKKKITKSDVGNALQTIARANLQKACGLSNVSQLASTLESLAWVTADAEWEKQYEGDDSQVPAMLREGYKLLAEALKVMAAEETAEQAAEQDKQAGETEAVIERAAKAKVKKAEGEEEEEAPEGEDGEDAPKGDEGEGEGNDAPTDTDEAAGEGEEEKKPAREYSDEDKLALRAVYRMMKESGVLDDLAAEDEAAKADGAEGEEDAEKAKKSDDQEAEGEEDTAKADGEGTDEDEAAKAKKADGAEGADEEDEAAKAKKAEGAEGAEDEEEEDTAEKMAKGLGLGCNSDAKILKAAGFSSAQEAVDAIVKLNQVVEQMKKLPAMTKGVLRTVDRNGKVEEVSPADMIAKGEKPADVLAKILAGEVDTGPVAKYATPKPPAF